MAVMPIKQPASAADRLHTLTMRVDAKNRLVTFDGVQVLYYGDTLNVIVDNISGAVAANLELWLWEKEIPASTAEALVQYGRNIGGSFAAVTGKPSQAAAAITFDSLTLKAALAATPVGTPITARLIIREVNHVLVDMDVPVYPNPFINTNPTPDPEDVAANPYVRRDHLSAWAVALLASADLSTPDGMADAINQILVKLTDVTAS